MYACLVVFSRKYSFLKALFLSLVLASFWNVAWADDDFNVDQADHKEPLVAPSERENAKGFTYQSGVGPYGVRNGANANSRSAIENEDPGLPPELSHRRQPDCTREASVIGCPLKDPSKDPAGSDINARGKAAEGTSAVKKAESSNTNDSGQVKTEAPTVVDANAALAACESAKSSMMSVCQAENDKGMKTALGIGDTATAMLSMGAVGGAQAACGKVAEKARAANVVLGGWKAACGAAVWRCNSACSVDKGAVFKDGDAGIAAQIKAIKDGKEGCDKGTYMLDTVGTNMVMMIAGYQQSKACEKASQADLSAMCALNPLAPACAAAGMDCRNPSQASSMVCQCQQPASSGTVACQNLMAKLNNGNGQSLSSLAGAGAGGGAAINPGGMDGASHFGGGGDPVNFGPDGAGSSNAPQGGGGKGVQASTSGSAAGGKGGEGGGAAASGLNTKIAQGFWGGGGGFGGGGPSGSGSARAGQVVAQGGPGGAKMDLKQFLPGGAMDPNRRPAGVVGPDGITGPNLDLFTKMNMRFMALGHTLK